MICARTSKMRRFSGCKIRSRYRCRNRVSTFLISFGSMCMQGLSSTKSTGNTLNSPRLDLPGWPTTPTTSPFRRLLTSRVHLASEPPYVLASDMSWTFTPSPVRSKKMSFPCCRIDDTRPAKFTVTSSLRSPSARLALKVDTYSLSCMEQWNLWGYTLIPSASRRLSMVVRLLKYCVGSMSASSSPTSDAFFAPPPPPPSEAFVAAAVAFSAFFFAASSAFCCFFSAFFEIGSDIVRSNT
mmetsp:Transcript_74697/g.150294  ORF Transcript_74697/g.150294 Transcript_74697/m.150294 type:complete len:240 (+) Transcript_74697:461-1180(+)